ncbi:MAG: SpaA isopeptide-forming pilin-related protein, partial [Coriobacteriia bacterium]|nr:SpaA isopeptide-forming pilin-related protein [Coriobacteriia bacterium]
NKVSETGGVRVKKVDADTGSAIAGATFAVFPGVHADRASTLESGNPVATMTSGSDGIASVSGLEPGRYTAVELNPPSGYAVDESWCESFDADATQITDLTGNPARDTRMRGAVTLSAEKELIGDQMTNGQFTFELEPITAGAPMPVDAQGGVALADNGSDGHVAFGRIEYGDADVGHTYRYRIREANGQDARIKYSRQSYLVDVKVMRNAAGIVTETTYALEEAQARDAMMDELDDSSKADTAALEPEERPLLLAAETGGLRAADSGTAKGNTVTINLTGVGERTYYATAAYSWKSKGATSYTLKVVVGVHKRSDWYNSPLSGSVAATGQNTETFSGNTNAATTGTDIELKTYTFTWNRVKSDKDKDVTVKVSRTYNGTTYTSTAKFTVTVPALASYAVTYNGNGATSGSVSGQTKWYGEDLTLRSNGYTRTGYTFSKWNTKADGSGTAYNAAATYKANATATLYAQWTANTYRVRYLGNGATGGSTSDSTHTYGTAKNLTANGYTRDYYSFVNWNTKADGTGTSYTDCQSVRNLTATNNGTVTLYAIWKPDVPENDATYGKAMFTNRIKQRCGAHALKTDAETGRPLAGCSFEIQPGLADLGVPGELYDFDGMQVNSLTIVSEADGVARTPEDALSTGGLFRIRELSAPKGYALGDTQWRYFTSGEAEGQSLDTGEWIDEPLRTTAVISVKKSYVMKTGPSTEAACPIAEDEFSFELLEGDDCESAHVLASAFTPASADGLSTAVFPELEYTADDVGMHTYWIREVAGMDARIAYDTAPRRVTVNVFETQTPEGATMLQADVAYRNAPETSQDAGSDTPPKIQNVLNPGFDVRVYKHGGNGAGVDPPLGGAVFALFELPSLGNGSVPTIPAVFADLDAFQAAFAIDDAGAAYSYDASQLETDYGIRFAERIVTGRDGYAVSENAALDSDTAYAIVEVRAPAGYLLADSRNGAGAKTPVYLIDDLAADGTYAHVSSVDTDATGNSAVQPDRVAQGACQVSSGYKVLVGEAAATADSEFAFVNEHDGKPRGGLAVRKVSAETGEPLSGARFAIYPEGDFSSTYADWRSHADTSVKDTAFLDAINESFAYDAETGQSSPNPYYLKPLEADLEPTGPDGWTTTGDAALPVGDYRVVEISAPAGFEIAPYDFTDVSGAAANIHVSVSQDQVTHSETVFEDPAREPRECSAPIVARKTLMGGSLSAGQFEFALYTDNAEPESTPLVTARNAEDGTVELATFRYDESEGGTYSIFGPNDEVLESSTGQTVDTSWQYILREIVPADATCSIDDQRWSYADYIDEYGFEEAAAFPWTSDGVTYDASLIPVEISIDGGDPDAKLTVRLSYPEGDCFDNAVEFDGCGGVRAMKSNEQDEGIAGTVFEIAGTTAEGAPCTLDIVSDDDGIAETARDALPLGTYTIREKTAPPGYFLNDEWSKRFSIEEEGQFVDFSNEEASWCVDMPDNSPIPLPITGGPGLMLPTALALTAFLLGTRYYAKSHPKPPAAG